MWGTELIQGCQLVQEIAYSLLTTLKTLDRLWSYMADRKANVTNVSQPETAGAPSMLSARLMGRTEAGAFGGDVL